jgi:hypothetical protein
MVAGGEMHYVDPVSGLWVPIDALRKSGDTMDGDLRMAPNADVLAYDGTSGVYTNNLEVYDGKAWFYGGAASGITPTASSDLVNKTYADLKYPKTGGTISGSVTVQGASGITATGGGIKADMAAGGTIEALSTTMRARFWPEEANQKMFFSCLNRSTSAAMPMEFQASAYLFQYGKVSMVDGLDFGSAVAANAQTVTRHLALYGTTYGFSITSSALNYISGGQHYFRNTTGGLNVVHASSYATTLMAFNSENPIPDAAVPDEPEPVVNPLAKPDDPPPPPPLGDEVDLAAMISILYDTVMSLPGGKAAFDDKAKKYKDRKKDKG